MTVFQYIVDAFPEFDSFTAKDPDWYRAELDYGMASRALDFARELKRTGRLDDLRRLFDHVEAGVARDDAGIALCLDFVQRIVDLAGNDPLFIAMLGPRSRSCYTEE